MLGIKLGSSKKLQLVVETTPLLLDSSNTLFPFSFNKFISSYEGNCICLFNSDTEEYLDIPFSGNKINLVLADNFLDGAEGRLNKIYAQNGLFLVQEDPLLMPKFKFNGLNANPSISFNAGTFLIGDMIYNQSTLTCYATTTMESTTRNTGRLVSIFNSGNDYDTIQESALFIRANVSAIFGSYRSRFLDYKTITFGVPFLGVISFTANQYTVSKNLESATVTNLAFGNFNVLKLMIGNSPDNNFWNGELSDLIITSDVVSATIKSGLLSLSGIT